MGDRRGGPARARPDARAPIASGGAATRARNRARKRARMRKGHRPPSSNIGASRRTTPDLRSTSCYDLTVFALVALPHSAPEPLVYRIPPELEAFAAVGARVRVPVRDRELTGIVVEVEADSDLDPAVVRPLLDVLDPAPLLPEELLRLARFITDYYRCPLGTTLAAMLPARLLRADSEMVFLTPSGVSADPTGLGAAGAGHPVGARRRRRHPRARAARKGRLPGPATPRRARPARPCRAAPAAPRSPATGRGDRGADRRPPARRAPGGVPAGSPATRGPAVAGRRRSARPGDRAPSGRRLLARDGARAGRSRRHRLLHAAGAATAALGAAVRTGAPHTDRRAAGRGSGHYRRRRGRWLRALPARGRHRLWQDRGLPALLSRASWNAEGAVSCWSPRSASRQRPRAPSSAASAAAPRWSTRPNRKASAGESGAGPPTARPGSWLDRARRCSPRCRTSG